jgi:hypothetical protein
MGRKWESVICYEDRGGQFQTSRWRLSGISTLEDGENTDGGLLWLEMSRDGDTVTANLYKDAACGPGDEVAAGTADASGMDGTGDNAALVELSEANSSGIAGSFRLHRWESGGVCPVQVALCVDEDLHALWDGIESLPGHDPTRGCAEFIRLAGEDLLAKVAAILRDRLGGHGAAEAWFIQDASRSVPDLRRIANPGQLRAACAHRALEIAIGRSHKAGCETMYSHLRDYHHQEYERAVGGLLLAVRTGAGGASEAGSAATIRQSRA